MGHAKNTNTLKILAQDKSLEPKAKYYSFFLQDEPTDVQEAMLKWNSISKAVKVLQVMYNIPNEKVEQIIALSSG